VATAKGLVGSSPGDAVILAEFALVNVADAVLIKEGWRVKGVNGGHEARFDFPLLPAVFGQNQKLIDQARRARNEEAYGPTHPISGSQAKAIVDLAERAATEVAKLLA
jgi:hypothetical protein